MKNFVVAGVFLAFVSFSALAAGAASPTVTVPQPLVSNYDFTINCTPAPNKVGDTLHFEILVASRSGTFTADSLGSLEIFDEQNRILSCDLQMTVQEKKLKYEFDLSPKYLTKSRFAFKCTGKDEKGVATAEVLWVHLKDYSTAK